MTYFRFKLDPITSSIFFLHPFPWGRSGALLISIGA